MTRPWGRLLLGAVAICFALISSDAGAFWIFRGGTERPSRFATYPPGSPVAPQQAALPPAGSQATPTFDYGYFGSRTRPFEMNHIQYYGEVRQTFLPVAR